MALEFTTTTVQLLALGVIAFTMVVIFATKWYVKNQEAKDLGTKHKGEKWSSPLEARTKYPELDVFSLRGSFLGFGFAAAIGLMILALGWTTYEERSDIGILLGDISDDIEIETPRTAEPPPPPPPPPAPSAMQIVENDLPEVETVLFEDQSITEETVVEKVEAKPKKATPPPPPPPPPPVEDEKEIFKIVEENPTFPGCEHVTDKAERTACAEEKMLAYIAENIKYPSLARDNRIQGMVVIQFVVEPDGSISNARVVRDIGAECGAEALRVVNSMPKWNPGKQRGRAVRVQFTLPVRFVLA